MTDFSIMYNGNKNANFVLEALLLNQVSKTMDDDGATWDTETKRATMRDASAPDNQTLKIIRSIFATSQLDLNRYKHAST